MRLTTEWTLAVLLLTSLGAIGSAQTTSLKLLQDVSSKLPTGTSFAATDGSGKIYKGYVVTHPARRFLRRGSMVLVFTDPVVVVTKDQEGVFRGGNKIRLIKVAGSVAAAKLADDAVDGVLGATKARYFAAAVSAALMLFQKGDEASLHAGDTIQVEPRLHR